MNTVKTLEEKGIVSRDKTARSIKIIDPNFSPKTIFRHFKGGLYEILHNATFQSKSDIDNVSVVVYKNVEKDEIFVRTTEEFFGKVVVDGKTLSRFMKIDPFGFLSGDAKDAKEV